MTDYAAARTTAFQDIPVIDVSSLGRDPDATLRIGETLVRTARDVGFFYIAGHGLDPAKRKAAFDASARFFALPERDKATVHVDQNQRGWMGQGMTHLEGANTHDAKEVFFWGWETLPDDPDYQAGVPMVAPNQWPDEAAPWLRAAVSDYYADVISLGQSLMGALAAGLGAKPDVFQGHYEKPLARGQLVYYPPAQNRDTQEMRFGAAAHTDFGALTILAQDDSGGLQVQNTDGDWIEAPPVENSFVCNIGDLLQMWTGGTLKSTPHRVINRSDGARYSIPVFFDPASTALIDPQDLGYERDGPVTTAGEHIQRRNSRNFTQYKT